MTKMKVLDLNRKFLRLLGMCLNRDATRREFYFSAFANVFMLTIYFAYIGSSAMFFINNLDNMGEAIYSLMQVVAVVAISGTYVSFVSNKNTTFDFFDELQQFVNESKSNFDRFQTQMASLHILP